MFIHGGGSYSKGYFSLAKTLNEKFNIENFYKGIETIPHFHKYFAEMS